MPKLLLRPQWSLQDDGRERGLNDVIGLLAAVEEEGNLSRACRRIGTSYRHAWGLIQAVSTEIGSPLLRAVRGKGATLSPVGERLVWANRRMRARLSPLLESLAAELDAEIRLARSEPRVTTRIHASHSFATDALRDYLVEHGVSVEVRHCGSADALASLSRGSADLAGFHVPVGALEAPVFSAYRKWLDPRTIVLIQLITRRQGIMVAPRNPKRIGSLADLAHPGIRFVNRQLGSGTRMLLDLLLERERIDSHRISGFDTAEYTHAAVAAYIASGMADAGVGIETAARLFHLNFVPLVQERYFLACSKEALASPTLQPLVKRMRSREFRARLSELPGVDGSGCGEVITIADAFPQVEVPLRGKAGKPVGRKARRS